MINHTPEFVLREDVVNCCSPSVEEASTVVRFGVPQFRFNNNGMAIYLHGKMACDYEQTFK